MFDQGRLFASFVRLVTDPRRNQMHPPKDAGLPAHLSGDSRFFLA